MKVGVPNEVKPDEAGARYYLETRLYSRTLGEDITLSDGTVYAAGTIIDEPMMEAMRDKAVEVLEAVGATDIQSNITDAPPGLAIHEMGTARMGRDPETSVLNGKNQCHDVPNLFVADGACMASSAHQNPSLTYMAIAARASHLAADMYERNDFQTDPDT